jgi:hypothetical protein
VINAVWERPQSGSALLMSLALADFADDAGSAFPSIARLAKKARIMKRKARKLIGKPTAEGATAMPPARSLENAQSEKKGCAIPPGGFADFNHAVTQSDPCDGAES